MVDHELERASTTGGLPVAPSLGPALAESDIGTRPGIVGPRDVLISAIAIVLALAAGFIAQGLTRLIGLATNLAFYGRVSTAFVSPAEHHLGAWVIVVPVLGGLVVGVMARFGSAAIRGHGIPEAMEQVLTNQSRIPKRITFLKPLSAAISIGTGGPFGAEGPIIATGGALGSLIGQVVNMTASERKTLLSAGAAAGMAATFGSPVSAALLAIELLLFEYRPRSLIPVALAAVTATSVRMAFVGTAPVFPMPELLAPSATALAFYIAMGALVGVCSVLITRAVYAIEDAFERLPIHWMWWPALGGIAVGVIGYFAPRTMGVGYDNIEHIVAGELVGVACLQFCLLKFLSWSIALGSGTSGGTLAPLFTIGGGLGSTLGLGATLLLPHAGIDVRVAALVGMAAMFAGASRALLASVVFAFETTRAPLGLLPLLGGCSAAFFAACLLMRNSIMTEKIERRGVRVIGEYATDYLSQLSVRDVCLRAVTTLRASDAVNAALGFIASNAGGARHQAFPVLDAEDNLLGVVTARELYAANSDGRRVAELLQRTPLVIFDDCCLRDAADLMARERIGRLPVVTRAQPRRVIGIVTRSDLVEAHSARLQEHVLARPRLVRAS